jgi:plastocyanin
MYATYILELKYRSTISTSELQRWIPNLSFVFSFISKTIGRENTKMNNQKNKSEQKWLIAATIMVALSVTAVISGTSGQSLQRTFAENTTTYKMVNPNQSTNKEFWINTVHLDGNTNLNPGVRCDTCPQNTPLHPAEQPPVNSTIPVGGGFRITEPNKVGAWDFRSFTFSPDQIVVNQGDKVTLHFIGVQGAHHVVTVQGVDTFELMRGQIHTVSFVANNPGTITYICHVHLPNMVGQILVLPKAA